MISKPQIILIHQAQRELGMDDGQYRLILRNVAHVKSCKDLNNTTFEDVMAFFESRGWQHEGKPGDYWTNKVQRRGSFGNERQADLIERLAKESRYNLSALCYRFSKQRTDELTKLTSGEMYALTEMLKSATARQQKTRDGQGCLFTPGQRIAPGRDAGPAMTAVQ